MLTAGKSKINIGSNRQGSPGGSGSRGSPSGEAKLDSASNRTGNRGGISSRGSPTDSDKKSSPTGISPKPSPPKAPPGTDVAADPKASASVGASPSSHKKKSSLAIKHTKSRTKQRTSTADSAGVKETETKDDGKRPGCSTSPADVPAAQHGERKSSPDSEHRQKGQLRMPDGTYVGVEERNRYIRAMKDKYLKCHYAPFVFVLSICIFMVMFLYIQIYHPEVWDDSGIFLAYQRTRKWRKRTEPTLRLRQKLQWFIRSTLQRARLLAQPRPQRRRPLGRDDVRHSTL